MADREIKAVPESYFTSTLTPIILSESQHVQLSFVGKQVDNRENKQKNIRGKLIIKKKAKNESFSSEEKFSRKDIHNQELVEIDLDTSETYALGKGLYDYFRLFSGKLTNPYDEITYIEKDAQVERLKSLIENNDRLIEVLSQIDTQTLNVATNIENLKRIYSTMQQNMSNDKEVEFWQPFFEQNAWILSQLFHAPVMFFQGKRYVGGKGLDNHGGQLTDFIYKNDITDNVALIEIKTPAKSIIDSHYRQSFVFSAELVGAINQILLQKDTLFKNYTTLLANSDETFRANNIDCVLVYGTVQTLNKKEKEAFDNYRNELRSIRIIGFDELLYKIENLLKLFEGKPDIPQMEDEEELPF